MNGKKEELQNTSSENSQLLFTKINISSTNVPYKNRKMFPKSREILLRDEVNKSQRPCTDINEL